ncbi:MAG TPA: hypothetical protein VGI43_10195 [Mucilaginibacter sp.]|jgi:hypothetical protein
MKQIVLWIGLVIIPVLLKAQTGLGEDAIRIKLRQLDKMRGTWMLTYPDTALLDAISLDTILTTFTWSAKGDTLAGKQRFKNAHGTSYMYLFYSFNTETSQYSYIENDDPDNLPPGAPLIINGDTWTYPNGDNRVIKKFSSNGKIITYYIQYLKNGQWVTKRKGAESRIK